jgi:hypothetical protein
MDRETARLRAPSADQTEELRSQNVKRVLSERETVVELPWLRTVVRA